MSSRQRKLAKTKGEIKSQLFKKEFFQFQKYGAKKARELKLTQKDAKKLMFEDR